jgi:hypothetical protein
VGDNFVCVKPCIFDLGGDISAPDERTGKVGKALAMRFVVPSQCAIGSAPC